MKFWINTVCKDHVMNGKDGGIIQAGHGKAAPLKRLSADDLVVYYSPKTALNGGQALQSFTAACRIGNGSIYQVEVSPDFSPFRSDAEYLDIDEAVIEPLIESLDFITSKKSWGFPFRRGLFEIAQGDFEIIADAMSLKWQENAA